MHMSRRYRIYLLLESILLIVTIYVALTKNPMCWMCSLACICGIIYCWYKLTVHSDNAETQQQKDTSEE